MTIQSRNTQTAYTVDYVVRIIAGEFRSRVLKTLPGMALRPTSDRLRETLFNILGPPVKGSVFLDCYAGSGAVGLEALSRGAVQAIFLEQSKDALVVLRRNIEALGVAGRTKVIEGPVRKAIHKVDGDITFLDPPYAAVEEYEQTLAALAASGTGALIVVEHAARMVLPVPVGLHLTRLKRQGDSALSFFVAKKIATG